MQCHNMKNCRAYGSEQMAVVIQLLLTRTIKYDVEALINHARLSDGE